MIRGAPSSYCLKPFKCPPVSPGSGGLHHHIGPFPFGAPQYLHDPGGSVIILSQNLSSAPRYLRDPGGSIIILAQTLSSAPRYLYDPGGSVITLAHTPFLFLQCPPIASTIGGPRCYILFQQVPPDSNHNRGAQSSHPFSPRAPRWQPLSGGLVITSFYHKCPPIATTIGGPSHYTPFLGAPR